jgi:trans-aconitate 2-methyltransferase
MPTWDAAQYLRFAEQRTRPCRDLVAQIAVEAPGRIVDLGCGPGNSTAVLAARWPGAVVTGIDSSAEMIAAARAGKPEGVWEVGDIATWAEGEREAFDVVFSNAALQWVGGHAAVLPRLLGRVAPGGALAVQMPNNHDSPAHEAIDATAAAFGHLLPVGGVRTWHVEPPELYYDVLAPHAAAVDIWETEYLQVMPDAAALVEWYKGTGLRPCLDALPGEAARQGFLAEYGRRVEVAYPARADGRVLFPFRRLFVVAYRGERRTRSAER